MKVTVKDFIADHLVSIGKDAAHLKCAVAIVIDYPADPLEKVEYPVVKLKVGEQAEDFFTQLQIGLKTLYTQNLTVELWFKDGSWSDVKIDYDTCEYKLKHFKAPEIPDTLI